MKLISIKKFCNDYYLCFHYRYRKSKIKRYNLYYRNRLLMIRITGPIKAKRILRCADVRE